MAGKRWGAFFDLEESLVREGPSYSFFQAVRLIRLMLRRREECGVKGASSIEGHFLRVRPELTLGFPTADIAGIAKVPLEKDEYRFIINATFLGLYGTSSPLPSFYTEDLLFEAGDDRSVTRDFIDIINTPVYRLFLLSLLKYNLFLQICEEKNEEYLERIYCLTGISESVKPADDGEETRRSLLRYAGIISQHPRSALGLKTILSDALNGIPVKIRQCIPQMVSIPDDQQSSLGMVNATLGEDLYIGSEIPDCMGKFRIIIGPVPTQMFSACLPGGAALKRAVFLVDNYLNAPLEYDFELLFDPAAMPAISLGDASSAILGVNSWLDADCSVGYIATRFEGKTTDN